MKKKERNQEEIRSTSTTPNNGVINGNLRADIMRKKMENKDLLIRKGSMYIGTGPNVNTDVYGKSIIITNNYITYNNESPIVKYKEQGYEGENYGDALNNAHVFGSTEQLIPGQVGEILRTKGEGEGVEWKGGLELEEEGEDTIILHYMFDMSRHTFDLKKMFSVHFVEGHELPETFIAGSDVSCQIASDPEGSVTPALPDAEYVHVISISTNEEIPHDYSSVTGELSFTTPDSNVQIIIEGTYNGLCITSRENNSSVGYTIIGLLPDISMQISVNKNQWTNWNGSSIVLNNNDKAYIRNTSNTLSLGTTNYLKITGTGKYSLDGSVSSLINYNTTVGSYSFEALFYENTAVVAITNDNFLPQTGLGSYCFRQMFRSCSNLEDIGNLKASLTAATQGVFYYTFAGCTKLTKTPILNLTAQSNHAFHSMFAGCTALKTIRTLDGTISSSTSLKFEAWRAMFDGCTSLEDGPEELKFATTGATNAAIYMFRNCKALKKPPIITYTAATLSSSTFGGAFSGCTALKVSEDSGDNLFFTSPTTTAGMGDMFTNTGGSFVGSGGANKTYYYNDEVYALTKNLTNCTITETRTKICSGESNVQLTAVADTDYILPAEIEVTGATLTSYDPTTGIILLNNFTADVNITIVARQPLIITAVENNSLIGYAITGSLTGIHIQTSTDGNTWNDWDGSNITLTNVNDKIYIRNTVNTLSTGTSNYFHFTGSGQIKVSGDIFSMINFASLSNYCFNGLFHNNISIISYDDSKNYLSNKTLATGCYRALFLNCSSLTTFIGKFEYSTAIPINAFASTFQGCTSLVNGPSAITFVGSGGASSTNTPFANMFNGCTSLKIPPIITYSNTTLHAGTFGGTFSGCSNLLVSREYGGDVLFYHSPNGSSNHSYQMFLSTGGSFVGSPANNQNFYYNYNVYAITKNLTNCTITETRTKICSGESNVQLTVVPNEHYILPDDIILTGADYTYDKNTGIILLDHPVNTVQIIITAIRPFNLTLHLTNLTSDAPATFIPGITIGFTISTTLEHFPLPQSITFEGVSGSYDKNTGNVSFIAPQNNVTITAISEYDGLKITALEDNVSIGFNYSGDIMSETNIQYSEDGKNWNNWYSPIYINAGEYRYFRNTVNTLCKSTSYWFEFGFTNKVKASGNCNSMINFAPLSDYCFYGLFSGCSTLIEAPSLPATELASHCYDHMFSTCTSLVSAPSLPASNLKNNCYQNMFHGCTSLVNTPLLPAIELASSCYSGMFSGCTNITSVPRDLLPCENLTGYNYCYSSMFAECTSLTNPPDLPSGHVERSCYESMFYGCTSLTYAPHLPATSFPRDCYTKMFYECSNLKVDTRGDEDKGIFYYAAAAISFCDDMFSKTGGRFKGTPTLFTAYYWYN